MCTRYTYERFTYDQNNAYLPQGQTKDEPGKEEKLK